MFAIPPWTKTKAIKIEPGDLFVVPLDEDCYALGLASRVSKSRGTKTVLGYFFDTKFSTVPTISEISNLTPFVAILIARFSGQRIMEAQWPKIGTYQSWDPEKWQIRLSAPDSGFFFGDVRYTFDEVC